MATAAAAREAFLAQLKRRMRRTVRGHDKPYAIFEPFGAREDGDFNETETFVLDMIDKVGQGQRDFACRFDVFSVDFWVDYHGDLKACDPDRFPTGLTRIREALKREGIGLGLWIDSSWEAWSIGGNPATKPALNFGPDKGLVGVPWARASFCRATEPVRSLYTEAFRHHIRENGVRLLKFDNFADVCQNPNHEHLPGIYSTQPIMDAVIEFLRALDAESPDVFLMGYWGYRSPWWLLYLDTLFETGIQMEAASPGEQAAPVAFTKASADYEQATYGGWPVSAVIDDDAKTGWSIDACAGVPHVALFRIGQPVGGPEGTVLTFELDQGERGHALGRFRLWVTSAPEPQLPAGYDQRPWHVTGKLPRTRQGGLMVIRVELAKAGKPLEIPGLGSHLSLEGTLAGAAAEFTPALGQRTYPSAWQSWRFDTKPERAGEPFELTVQVGGLPHCELRWAAHFIPDDSE